MCVDDYQFRHFSAKRQKMCRRFIFITQHGNQRAFNVNISQFQRFGQLCLCEILLHLSKKGLNTKDYSFHMPQFNITIEAGDKCKVPFQIMSSKEVIFEMNEIEKDTDNDNYNKLYYDPLNPKNEMESQKGEQMAQINEFISKSNEKMCVQCQNWKNSQVVEKAGQLNNSLKQSNNFEEQKSQKDSQSFMNSSYNIKITQTHNISEKKHKQQEKTIEQALTKTKTWRALHENCNFSLKNAAQMVQLSKKTLDDYFLVLRVGEAHGYNFKANLTKKIGHLRAFIRNQPVKISGRLPKQVSSFSLVPDPDMTKFLQIQNWDKMQHIEQQTIQKKAPNNQFQQEMIAE